MNDLPIALVQINQRIQQLIGPGDDLVAGKCRRLLRKYLRQIRSGNELHHQKSSTGFGEVVADARQARMMQLGQQTGFLLKLAAQTNVN